MFNILLPLCIDLNSAGWHLWLYILSQFVVFPLRPFHTCFCVVFLLSLSKSTIINCNFMWSPTRPTDFQSQLKISIIYSDVFRYYGSLHNPSLCWPERPWRYFHFCGINCREYEPVQNRNSSEIFPSQAYLDSWYSFTKNMAKLDAGNPASMSVNWLA